MDRLLKAPRTEAQDQRPAASAAQAPAAPSDAKDLAPAAMDEPLAQAPPFDAVRHYLQEIGQVPLLSAAEEVALAERMERGNAAACRLAAAADLSPQLRAACASVCGAFSKRSILRLLARPKVL